MRGPPSQQHDACDACGAPSQYRLFVCFECWRRVPRPLHLAWGLARTTAEKCAVADEVRRWAAAEEESVGGRR